MHALTAFELRDYRRQLEAAIAFFDQQDPVSPARAELQAAALDRVIAEQDDRKSWPMPDPGRVHDVSALTAREP
jgi:hypothetical protein